MACECENTWHGAGEICSDYRADGGRLTHCENCGHYPDCHGVAVCACCPTPLLTLEGLSAEATTAAGALTSGDLEADQKCAMAVYSLLLLGRLATTCKKCAVRELASAVDKILDGCKP